MRGILRISTILTWINMIIWGIAALCGLLVAITGANMAFLLVTFLISVIILHSYAALQLHKSIRNPAVPLSSQTPTGIRFIGFIALFLGMGFLADGFTILQQPGEFVRLFQSNMPQFKDMKEGTIRVMGIWSLFLGFCVSLNVFLNFRLLRWYQFMRSTRDDQDNRDNREQ